MDKVTYALHFTYHYDDTAPEDTRNQGVTLAPGEYVLLKKDVPSKGTIKKILINIPVGAADVVKFRLFVNQTQLFPSAGWFGFEGFNGIVDIYFPVNEGDKIYMEAINRGSNEHTISVTLILETS